MFCVSGLLSFFPLLYTVSLGVTLLKRLTILSLKPLTLFLIGSEIQLINQSHQMFLIGLSSSFRFCQTYPFHL